jgi:hypothetical protein
MTAHNEASHAVNRQFEEELDAFVRRYIKTEGICTACMADVLGFYADEIASERAQRALDLMTAGLLRSAGRLT